MRGRDLTAGLVLAGLGIMITRYSQSLSYLDEFGPGPGFLPYWLGLVLTALALGLVISAARTRTQALKPEAAGQGSGRALLTIAGLFAMVATLELLGFLPVQYWYLGLLGGLITPAMWPDPARTYFTGPPKNCEPYSTDLAGAMWSSRVARL